jgi:hypothetical protein
MNLSKLEGVLIILAFGIAASACNPHQTSVSANDQCIGSFDSFAYTVPDKDSSSSLAPTPPLEPWQIEAILPEEFTSVSHPFSSFSLEATRSTKDHTEIWVKNSYYVSDEKFYQYLVYDTFTKEWKVIPAALGNSGLFAQELYVTNDGTVWAQNFFDGNHPITNVPSVLSKYSEEAGRFELEPAIQGIPAARIDSGNLPHWSKVLLDSDEVFWILVDGDGIYSYQPSSQEIKRHTALPDSEIREVAIAPSGGIYFDIYPKDWTSVNIQNDELFQFATTTGEIMAIRSPSGFWPRYGRMLVEHNGRLWLDTVGWREANGAWHRIYANPLLYFWNMKWKADYRWHTPSIILESSDGRLWFRKRLTETKPWGMAWYDPQTGEGCWFTTEDANIVEDNQHTLRMIAGGKIYKNLLEP